MSTASLPSYIAPSLHTPAYTLEPQEYEQRIAVADRLRPRPSGNFVKRGGDVTLKLSAQEDNAKLPVYGSGACVEGVVELAKTDGVTSVEVKVDGKLKLKEVAEGGTTSVKLCLDSILLWIKDPVNDKCPPTLRFRLNLPSTFMYEEKSYNLPPTYDIKLSGLPGFIASIDYSVSTVINKPNSVPSLVPLVKSSLFGINIGGSNVSTPFIYYPRTRPAVPLPLPLAISPRGFVFDPAEWRMYESILQAKSIAGQDIITKLYVPASRIFCFSQHIPFHLTFESSSQSLAAFLPFGPLTPLLGKRPTKVQLMRQVIVDVRNEEVLGTKTDIWRVDPIGEANFRRAGDGPTWTAFSGEIVISDSVKVTGFKAGGLTIKDCILLTVTPPDPKKCPFKELRVVVPVRLTTDIWSPDGSGLTARRPNGSDVSVPTPPGEEDASL